MKNFEIGETVFYRPKTAKNKYRLFHGRIIGKIEKRKLFRKPEQFYEILTLTENWKQAGRKYVHILTEKDIYPAEALKDSEVEHVEAN